MAHTHCGPHEKRENSEASKTPQKVAQKTRVLGLAFIEQENAQRNEQENEQQSSTAHAASRRAVPCAAVLRVCVSE